MASDQDTAADYIRLPGESRRCLNTTTGETISRRQYDRLFRLGPRGFTSYEKLAASRATAGASPLRRTEARVRAAMARVIQGESATSAAKAEHLSPSTLRRHSHGTLRYNRATRRGEVHAAGHVSFFDASGNLHRNVPFAYQTMRTMSAYAHAVKDAKAGRVRGLKSFADVTVKDVLGNEYTLLADINGIEQREQVYGIDATDFFQSEDFLVAAPTGSTAA
jgi:hypothetical protein